MIITILIWYIIVMIRPNELEINGMEIVNRVNSGVKARKKLLN